MHNSVDTYLADEDMLAVLNPAKFSKPTQDQVTQAGQLQKALDMRAGLMRQLAKTYSTFNALAAYDASGEAEGAIKGLTGAVNAYAKALDKPQPISSTADIVIQAAAGAILREAQASRLRQASVLIRTRLEVFQKLLGDEAETYKGLAQVLASSATRTTLELYKVGIGSPHPIIAELIATPGFEYRLSEQQLRQVKPEDAQKIRLGVERIVERRMDKQAQSEQALIGDTQDGVQALITEHTRFEAGEALNLASLSAIIEKFRGIVDQINTARAAAQ